VPHISISDDNHHVTEAIGSYYDDEPAPQQHVRRDARPLSYQISPSEAYEGGKTAARRGGGYFDMREMAHGSASRSPLERTTSNEKALPKSPTDASARLSPKSIKRMGSVDQENRHAGSGPSSPPPLSRQGSHETAIQQFPLNDIDYESSPAAVAQELSNLQAIRRMSMSVDTADPDLPSFGGVVPSVAPTGSEEDDEDDAARLFWVPARLHPELAPKEFKTFVEDRVGKIRRRSTDGDGLSPESLERSGSGSSSLRRKKSMLSHQIDTKGNYEDGAERLERKRSKGVQVEGRTTVANLSELETLVNDPAQLMRRMSLDTARRSQDSGIEVPRTEDAPILPPAAGQLLKRSTRTTYRRGSLKKGERVPFSKRAQQRQSDPDWEETGAQAPMALAAEEPEAIHGLTRVQTEPIPAPSGVEKGDRTSSRRRPTLGGSQSTDNLTVEPASRPSEESRPTLQTLSQPAPREEQPPPPPQPRGPQPRQFQSRLASGGRTTAQLPGYNNQNPLPHIIETLPDGTKVPVGQLAQQVYPERKSSHDLPRPIHRGGAHMRPVPGRQQTSPSSTLDDISSHPSPLPGSGSTRTDALTMVPTFEDRKVDKKDSSRKSSWKWILGSDDDEKEKKAAKEEKALDGGLTAKMKSSRLTKTPTDKARLDVLQNSIDGTTPARGRESLVLNRADLQLEEERKKDVGKRASDGSRKEKDTSLLSAIFGGKKKTSDSDLKDKKRKSDRRHSPDPPPRVLKPDIDYNWTRFSILEERAIYRMAHIKLANPRRALYSQVLLSNFMYSYLAKVQMMHPQTGGPPQAQQQQQSQQQQQPQQQPQKRKESRSADYSQYQRYPEVSFFRSLDCSPIHR